MKIFGRQFGRKKRNWDLGEGTRVISGDVQESILSRIDIKAGKNCFVDISGVQMLNDGMSIHMVDNCRLQLGPHQLINGYVCLGMHEPSSITVGSDCLWARGRIFTSDMHSIVDNETGIRTNPAADVVIGNRVWFAEDFLVLRGSEIGDDSVVATKAVVTGKKFPPNSLIGGLPAKILRSGIRWANEFVDESHHI